MSYTQALADYIVNLKYKDLPKEVIQQAKLITLHTVGVALASYPTEQAKKAIALAKGWGGGKKESTLFGDGSGSINITGGMDPCPQARVANQMLCIGWAISTI